MSLQERIERIMTSLSESVSDLQRELGEWSTPHVCMCTHYLSLSGVELRAMRLISPGNGLEASSLLIQEEHDP